VPAEAYIQQVDPVGLEAFEEQIEFLKESGYEIRKTDLFASIDKIAERHRRLNCAERAIAEHDRYEEYTDLYPAIVEDDILEGREISVDELAELRSKQFERREAVSETMEREGVDVWISPTAPGPAPEGLDWTGDPAMNVPWSRTGVPVVSVPVGQSPEELPLGLRFGASFNEDERLLAWAKDISGTLKAN
jgi:Asp-tRNA(Asn)/Glu-tRNA(Gln) amidotransferase A subunit family amidase